MGEFTGSGLFTKAVITAIPIFAGTIAEGVTKEQDDRLIIEKAKTQLEVALETYKKAGLDLTKNELNKHVESFNKQIQQPPKGMITRAYDNEITKHAYDTISSAWETVFGKKK